MRYAITVVIEVEDLRAATMVADAIEEAISDIDTGGVVQEIRLPVEVDHE